MIRKLLFAFFIICCPLVLWAQQYNFRTYSLEDGLPQSEVNFFVQDNRGYIWLGTNGGGLTRFNGKNFVSYTTDDGLSSDVVVDFLETSDGKFLISTIEGIDVFDGQHFKPFFQKKNPTDGHIQLLYRDEEGTIWMVQNSMGSNRKPSRYENGKFVDAEQYMPAGESSEYLLILQGQGKKLYFYSEKGIYTFDKRKNTFVKHIDYSSKIRQLRLRPVLEDHTGTIWFTNNTHLDQTQVFYYQNGDFKSFELPESFRKAGRVTLFEDSNHNIWMTNNSAGLLRYDGKEFSIFTEKNGLPNLNLSKIREDREGNIWFACVGVGLVKYSGDQFRSFNIQSGLPDEIVFSITQDSQGVMWITTSKGTIATFDGQNISYQKYPEMEATRKATELPDHTMLFASYSGLWQYDHKSFQRVNEKYGIAEGLIVTDLLLHEGYLYFSTVQGIVISYHLETGKTHSFEFKELDYKQIRSVYIDSNNFMWVATVREGAVRLSLEDYYQKNEQGITIIDEKQGLRNNHVMQFTEDKSGNIWLATYGRGIVRIKDNELVTFSKADGLASDNVYSIISDDQGNIWAGTQNGVDKLYLDEKGNVTSIRNFGLEEGFTGIENNGKAVYKDRDGNLWFGTIHGAIQYNHTEVSKNTKAPDVYISGLKLYYRSIDWQRDQYKNKHKGIDKWTSLPRDLSLDYKDNHITFEFEALSFKVPEKVKYQWMLKGLDKNWSPVSDKTEAVYSNLPPGEYNFLVKAANNDNVWSPAPASYTFRIAAPWWDTMWFKLSAVVFLVGFAVLMVRLRVNNIKAKKKELEWLVQEKTSEVVRQKDELIEKTEALEKAYQNLELLTEMGKDITSTLSVEKIIGTIYENLNALMDAPVFWIGIYDKKQEALVFKGAIEKGEKLDDFKFDIKEDSRLAVKCFKDREEILIADYDTEYNRYVPEHLAPVTGGVSSSVVYLPLIRHEKVYGVISVQSFEKKAYNNFHLNILKNIATYAQIALENAKAYEKIEEKSRNLKAANDSIVSKNREIECKNEELIQLNQEKNHLIGIVAHDLRNPLTSAMTMANLLNSEADTLSEDQKEYTHYMLRAIKRMDQMITRILNIKVIESKKIELDQESLNLKKLVNSVCRQFESTVKNKHLSLHLELDDVHAEVDRNYCLQIIENLVSNAIKFSPANRKVWISLKEEGNRTRMFVRDEGPGLTADDHKKLFGKFQKLSAQPTAGEQSIGLGLSIVKKYVEAMQGNVWCESEPGMGATFIVEFPSSKK